MQAGATVVADQTATQEAQASQPQIAVLPDSREMETPTAPPYEAVFSATQASQPQIVVLPDSREMETSTAPPYEAVVSAYQTLHDEKPPSYYEALSGCTI